jgi:hypothetical protein
MLTRKYLFELKRTIDSRLGSDDTAFIGQTDSIYRVPGVMTVHTERILPLMLFLLVCMSFVATLPQFTAAGEGVRLGYQEDAGLRLLREAMLLVIMAYVSLDSRFRTVLLSKRISAVSLLFASYAAFEVGYALHLGLPIIVPLTGFRVFEYFPLALIGLMAAQMNKGEEVFGKFAGYLRYFVAIEAIFAIQQVLWAPPLYGTSVFGGDRAFGTFVAPNQFGVTMATCVLLYTVTDRRELRKWALVSGVLVLLSGSRTAILSALLVLIFRIYYALRARDRWMITLPMPFLFAAALALASMEAVSGRDIDLAREGRLELWREVYGNNVTNGADFLIGWGLGLGSNTITTLFGQKAFPGQFCSDSLYLFLLNGYGMIGLVSYAGLLFGTWKVSGHSKKLLVLCFITLSGATFNMWEYFPQNALLMFLWGYTAGTLRRGSSFYLTTQHGILGEPRT